MIGYDFYYIESDESQNKAVANSKENIKNDTPGGPQAQNQRGPSRGTMLVAAGAASAAGAIAFNRYARNKVAEQQRLAAEKDKGIVGKIVAFIKAIFKSIVNAVKKLFMNHKVKQMVKMYRKVASRNPDIANAPVNATIIGNNGKLKNKTVSFGKLISLIDQNMVQYSKDMDNDCKAIIKSVEEGKGRYKEYNYDIAQSMRLRRKMMMANLNEANNQLKIKDHERARADAKENLKMAKRREILSDFNSPDVKASAKADVEKYENELKQLAKEWQDTERSIMKNRSYNAASVAGAMY